MRKQRTNRSELRAEISRLLRSLTFSQTGVSVCEAEGTAPQEEFLLRILKSELANRNTVRQARFLHEAAFTVYKIIEAFDFASLNLPPALSKQEFCSASFITDELIVRLSEAFAAGLLKRFLASILKAELLIIDEWGYVPVDRQGAQLLFRIISDSYERRSIILTTNLEFSKWGTLFTDDQMAAAMIDRLAHHGHILLFQGDSFRMKNALMRQKGQSKILTA